ncbi:MAG: dehydrogenase [Candidatus Eisenbacteria bacterium]|nr:dehydrogenase [Candidatus Latescibacterota bacterium]MBD3303017.1 dehydrogenase [Candidatus Eisenbacteria bacterium]
MASNRKAEKTVSAESSDLERRDLALYESLWMIREFDQRISGLHKQGKALGGAYSCRGQEAIQVGACHVMHDGDYIFPIHRDLGVFLLRGIPPRTLMAQILGKKDGLSGGRDSFLHSGDPARKVIGATSMLGATYPVATGVALAFKIRRQPNLAIGLLGEGATSRGDFHEALNFAGIHKLPVLYVIENNMYAYSTPPRLQMPTKTVAERAEAYGMPGVRTNGNDLHRVLSVMEEAADRARRGEGPTLIECLTYRVHGHSEHDPAKYRSQQEWFEWAARDPIELYELYLQKRDHDVPKVREEVRAKVGKIADDAIEYAQEAANPEGAEALEHIWSRSSRKPEEEKEAEELDIAVRLEHGEYLDARPGLPVRTEVPETIMPGVLPDRSEQDEADEGKDLSTYIEAIRRGLEEEMDRDENVILLGEDIGTLGGAFGATKGLIDTFGAERVIDTPISESLIVGASVGASIAGMRAVAEMQFADFISCAFDQIVNTAATLSYRHAGRVGAAIVVRAPAGARIHGGLFHSQNPESFFLSTPGIKIVAPATAADAKGLLKSAVRDDNPVIFLEYKYLYRRAKGELPGPDTTVPIGVAALRRLGKQVTILTYGPTLPFCLEAADQLAGEGIEAEVIDLRTIKPLDMETIRMSVAKTHRLMIVHEDRRFSGLGAEISARIGEEMFDQLDAPIRRVATLDTHYAFSAPMEEFILPDTEKVVDVARSLVRF